MKRQFGRILAALLLGMVGVLLSERPALADDTWRIDQYHSQVVLAADGTAQVRTEFTFDFGSDPGHGPYLTFPLRQEIADDPDHWRMIDMKIGDVTSPSGADTTVRTEEEDGNLIVRIGREGRTYTGKQTYQVEYTARGLIAPRQAQSGLDEFNWNAVGLDWEVPIYAAAVEVTGPAEVVRAACFQGTDYRTSCRSEHEGSAASFAAPEVGDGRGMQVVAGFPAGTFVGAEARLTSRFNLGTAFALNPLTGGVTALLTAIGVGGVLLFTRRSARDQAFSDLAPGVVPPDGAGPVGPAAKVPVAVRFEPPTGARPGEIGTLIDATGDSADITGTILDLAVRGQLRISQGESETWTFKRLATTDPLVGYEQQLLDQLFAAGEVISTTQLGQARYAQLQPSTRRALNTRVTTELKWFRADPSQTRTIVLTLGMVLAGVSCLVGLILSLLGWGLLGLAGIVTGLVIVFRHKRFGRRTALGSAMLAQAQGFELYLRTAEADQIKFEEGNDIFSRYLPWAVVFGLAERWVAIFNQLAAEGRYEFATPWYVGPGDLFSYGFAYHAFAGSMDSLTHSMSASMQAASQASSGGSGFGGGGFSGGGGGFGGGGGGGW